MTHSPSDADTEPRRFSPNAEGALWMLASVAGASAMTVIIRILTPDIHSTMVAFLRASLAVFVVLPLLWRARTPERRLSFSAWPLHLVRGLLIAFALNAGFYAIWKLPMATATILFFMGPIYATIIAQVFLAERVGPRRWTAIGVGFLGALVILRPGIEPISLGIVMALLSSVAFSASLIIGKDLSRRDSSDSVFVSSTVVVAFGALPPALYNWELPVDAWQWALIAALVAVTSVRTYSDIRAFAVGEVGFIAPFAYLRLLVVGVAGYVWFDEVLDWPTVLGGAVIVASTLYISLREAWKRRAPAAPDGES
jgi:drug/metabolite transporter (DMT)-like permease